MDISLIVVETHRCREKWNRIVIVENEITSFSWKPVSLSWKCIVMVEEVFASLSWKLKSLRYRGKWNPIVIVETCVVIVETGMVSLVWKLKSHWCLRHACRSIYLCIVCLFIHIFIHSLIVTSYSLSLFWYIEYIISLYFNISTFIILLS